MRRRYCGPSALPFLVAKDPGRCPGLPYSAPLGQRTNSLVRVTDCTVFGNRNIDRTLGRISHLNVSCKALGGGLVASHRSQSLLRSHFQQGAMALFVFSFDLVFSLALKTHPTDPKRTSLLHHFEIGLGKRFAHLSKDLCTAEVVIAAIGCALEDFAILG